MWSVDIPVYSAPPTYPELDEDCRTAQPVLFVADTYTEVEQDCRADSYRFAQTARYTQSLYQRSQDNFICPLPGGYTLVYSPYAPAGPAVLSQAAWEQWLAYDAPSPLRQQADRTLVEQGLIRSIGASRSPVPIQGGTLTAWLHVSNACDLACPYCYVRKSSEHLSVEKGIEAIKAIFSTAQQYGFQRVKLKYAGGEATLHFRLIQTLHEEAVRLAEAAGLALQSVVLSNGVHLRREHIQWLARQDFKVMISVDGIGDVHDQLRPLHNGQGSFAKVAQTIDLGLLPQGIRPDINMTITRMNAHAAADVVRWALIERKLPVSFSFYRPPVLFDREADLMAEEEAIIEGMLAAYQVIEENLPAQPFLEGLLDRVQTQAHTQACGVGQNYVVVTHLGQLAQCQMHLNAPIAPAVKGDLLLQVANGPIPGMSVDDKPDCRQCTFRYRCAGGCPIETYRATGRWDQRSPNCRIYRTLYPAALRLEGLRLLKVHGLLDS